MITGVETFGLFCRGTDVPVEGLLHISRLGKHDYFNVDSAKFSIVGERTGQEYRIGDLLTVEVEKIDLDRRELDFRLPNSKKAGKPAKNGASQRGGKSSKSFSKAKPNTKKNSRKLKSQRGKKKKRK